MKPFIQFPYEPHSAKSEDKQIRAWRKEHDPNHSRTTFKMVVGLIAGLAIVAACIAMTVYYGLVTPLITLTCLLFVAVLIWVVISWSAGESEKQYRDDEEF